MTNDRKIGIITILFLSTVGFVPGLYDAAKARYLESEFYHRRFEEKFAEFKIGDSHERMIDLLGKPTHYCGIQKEGDRDAISAKLEIYRIGDNDYVIRFPATEVPDPHSSGTFNDVILQPAASKNIRSSHPPPASAGERIEVLRTSGGLPSLILTSEDRCANPY